MATQETKIQKVNQNLLNKQPLCAPSIFNDPAPNEYNIQIANEKMRNIPNLNKALSDDFFCPFKKYNQY
jgi:hypothetical protein